MECIKPISIKHMREAYNLQLRKRNRNMQPRFFYPFTSPVKKLQCIVYYCAQFSFSIRANQHKSIVGLLANSSYSDALCVLEYRQHLSASNFAMETDNMNADRFFALLEQQKSQLKKAQAYKGQKPPASMKRSRSVLQQEFFVLVWSSFSLPFVEKLLIY